MEYWMVQGMVKKGLSLDMPTLLMMSVAARNVMNTTSRCNPRVASLPGLRDKRPPGYKPAGLTGGKASNYACFARDL